MKTLLLIGAITLSLISFGQTSVKIGGLEVKTKDSGNEKKMHLAEAEKACAALGKDWRLPTKEELNFLYENMDEIGGFTNDYYWSGTYFPPQDAWVQSFSRGAQYHQDGKYSDPNYVRAVRAF
ncbi:DUF1566 domain-containing protein [Crocinitomicaceae bacterium]|nr:DUF1566 domain-containing protein [Crocinitomicaceae bacterium]